jgi:hypothetical protein
MKMYYSCWKAARRRAAARYEPNIGLPCPQGFRRIRVHDLKRTLGHGLRDTARPSASWDRSDLRKFSGEWNKCPIRTVSLYTSTQATQMNSLVR